MTLIRHFRWFVGLLMLFSLSCTATTISYWTTQTQSDRLQTLRLMADVFTALHPDVEVSVVGVDENDLPTQIAAAAAADTLPTIIEAGTNLALAFGEEGIIDIAATTEVVKKIGEPRFYKGVLALARNPQTGDYYQVPHYGWVQGIWYRADWFKKAGLAPPNTWENILKAAKYFYKPEQNQYGILIGTQADTYAEQVFTQIALSNSAREFNAKGQLVFNSKAMQQALDYYQQLGQYTPPGPQSWRARDYYLQGKLAMFFYSTYIMDDLSLADVAASSLSNEHFAELKGASFDPELSKHTRLAATITHSEPSTFGTVEGYSIMNTKDDAQRKAAMAFVNYMNEPDQLVAYMHMSPGGHLPVLRDIAASDAFLNDPRGVFAGYGKDQIKEIIAGFDSIKNFAVVDGKAFPASGEIFSKQIIPRMVYRAVIEKEPVAKAIDWAEQQMKLLVGAQ